MTHRFKRNIFTAVSIAWLLLAGCTVAPKAPTPSPVEVPQSEANNETREVMALLAQFQRVYTAPAEEQRKEYSLANLAYSKNKSDLARLKLAMLLSIPNTGFHDATRTLNLLEPIMSGKNLNGPARQLALLLQTQISERLREVREQQKHADALQQKLDALKTLEKSLIEREQSSRTRKK